MCDTLVVKRGGRVLFAKNSDRDANEAQVLEWVPRREHRAGARVACTHIEIDQVRETFAVVLSRPFWMWGAEMGGNEHGVVVGNEAVFTDQPLAPTGLTGMDLNRLLLERAETAERGVEILLALLDEHGQGGGCGFEQPSFAYHNSFLVADPGRAFVVETAGTKTAVEEVTEGVRSISNGLTIPGFADEHKDRLRSFVAACDVRSARTAQLGAAATSPEAMMAVLRDHGPEAGEHVEGTHYRALNGTLGQVCMHGGGLVVSSVSCASWVSELVAPGDGAGPSVRHFATGTSSPCLSVFKPVSATEPLDLGPLPGGTDDDGSLWWTHERLHRLVLARPERQRAFDEERRALEADVLGGASADAFARHREALPRWVEAAAAVGGSHDPRPWYARRYWRSRAAQAERAAAPGGRVARPA